MGRKRTYIQELGSTSTSGGLCTLLTNRLKPGQSLCIQLVSLRSHDTDSVIANLGVLRSGTLYRYDTVTLTTHDLTYKSTPEIWIESDGQLQIDFSAAGATKPVYAWVFGYVVDPD